MPVTAERERAIEAATEALRAEEWTFLPRDELIVDALLALPDPIREAAEEVDRAFRSFRTSVPFQPRDALWHLYTEKLAGPLERLRAALEASER